MRHTIIALATLHLLLVGCGDTKEPAEEPQTSPLEQAYTPCHRLAEDRLSSLETDTTPDDVIRLEDDGTTLIINTPDPGGDIASSLAMDAARCVLDETGAPATIEEKMGTTSALSGPGQDSYEGIDVEWSYAAGVGNAGFNAYFRVE